MPSGLVITRLPEPDCPTAQNKPSSGDQHTDCQEFCAGKVRAVHVVASPLVRAVDTLLPGTATKMPRSGDQQIAVTYSPAVSTEADVQLIPLALV